MPFDWLNYLDLAEDLCGTGPPCSNQEAKQRAGISRAYYAVYCLARNHMLVRDHQGFPQNVNEHEHLIQYFSIDMSPVRQEIGSKLSTLRRQRNRADYRDRYVDLQKQVPVCLGDAIDIVHDLSTL